MVDIKKTIVIIVSIIILGVLLIIPRTWFVSNSTPKVTVQNDTNLTAGPDYINTLTSNIIKVQAISGDMGNTIEYTIKDLITQNEASEILSSDSSVLENIKIEMESIKSNHPNTEATVNQWIGNINKIQSLNAEAIPYIQNFNESGLTNVQNDITSLFGAEYSEINGYKVNQNAYQEALAGETYKYNTAKTYIS
ncbi:hypothetical protein [uncultured Clostridium sp.]|uniref:hypothetical protein n=1 Tax=uncultured Clostridium sp. TaxID=59620 RepID=UPI00262B5DFE|nr:hypothetical protein [uncultured Clostridium sp.]